MSLERVKMKDGEALVIRFDNREDLDKTIDNLQKCKMYMKPGFEDMIDDLIHTITYKLNNRYSVNKDGLSALLYAREAGQMIEILMILLTTMIFIIESYERLSANAIDTVYEALDLVRETRRVCGLDCRKDTSAEDE